MYQLVPSFSALTYQLVDNPFRSFVSSVSCEPQQRQPLQTKFEIDYRPGTHLLERPLNI